MQKQYPMEFGDYIAMFHKRKVSFLVTFFLILIIGVTIAFVLPPVYRSEATILIERQEIPQNLVATTVTGYVQERIEETRQKLVNYDNLVKIAERYDLFPELRAKGEIDDMVAAIRRAILVKMIDVKASDSGKSGEQLATIAFTVGYEDSLPEVAQKVAVELSETYLEANKQARSEQASEVIKFLEVESEKLRQQIVTLETSLAKFKQEQSSELPELFQVNMRLFEKTEGEIESSKDRILKIEDQVAALQSELSLTDPRKAVQTDEGKVIQSPGERLNALTAQYLQNSARYAPNHPDMVRLGREIQVLGSQSTEAKKVSEYVARLSVIKSELLDARQKYSEEHPDVQRLEKSVASIENELRKVNIADMKDSTYSDIPADNPRYVSLKTQLDAAQGNLKEEQSKLKTHQAKLKEYEKRLFRTPIVERDFMTLTRDYGNAKAKYEDLKNKQLEARLALQLESGDKGERFTLAEPAHLPTRPDKPNRLGIVLLAGLLAFTGGIGALAIAEYKDGSVSGSRGVLNTFGSLPIVVIPYIQNSNDLKQIRSMRFVWTGVILGLLLILLLGFHLLVSPLDKLWQEPELENVSSPVSMNKHDESESLVK